MKLAISLCFLTLIIFSGRAYSQEPRVLYESATDDVGYFCSYEPSPSGDSPDTALISNDNGAYYLSLSLDEAGWDLVTTQKKDTPVSFRVAVISYYNESGGDYFESVFMTNIKKTGEPRPGSCKTPRE
jgi:hypothetical protein